MGKSCLFAAVFALAISGAAGAGSSDCRNAVDQNTMSRCAYEDFQAADQALNATYSRVMAAIDDEGYKAKLRMAQRNWIQFRDNECTFETAENEGGSIYPMVYNGCLARLTKQRTRALDAYLSCWKNAQNCGE